MKRCVDIQNIIMADVFELELHDIHEDDPNRAPDSDDDIIEVDEVIQIPLFSIKNLSTFNSILFFIHSDRYHAIK